MLARFKYLIICLFILFFHSIGYTQSSVEPQLTVGTAIIFGTQNNLLRFTLNAMVLVQRGVFATELSGGADFDLFLSKYGAKTNGKALRLEGYFIAGSSKEQTGLPYYSGELSAFISPEKNIIDHVIYGGGIGINQNILFGELEPLSNRQGLLLVRTKISDNPFLIRIKNDFRAGFMFGSGTDQGETGSLHLSYSFIDQKEQLHLIGVNLLLFTPIPDYSLNPTHDINSQDHSRPVLKMLPPFSKLFHGNLYGQYRFQSNHFSQNINLGIDSQKMGGVLQNALHDSFGLYPRFPWNMTAKNKLYFQSQSSFNYDF